MPEIHKTAIVSDTAILGDGVVISPFCNIWGSPVIGAGTKVGAYTEIGDGVVIGKNVTIGAKCFIPPMVFIDDGAWIGPGVFFSNDRRPPSKKSQWETTIVKKNAVITAGARVRCGVVIGGMVGMGAVATKDIPEGETWAGVPARKLTGGAV